MHLLGRTKARFAPSQSTCAASHKGADAVLSTAFVASRRAQAVVAQPPLPCVNGHAAQTESGLSHSNVALRFEASAPSNVQYIAAKVHQRNRIRIVDNPA